LLLFDVTGFIGTKTGKASVGRSLSSRSLGRRALLGLLAVSSSEARFREVAGVEVEAAEEGAV
jgi:hypothetical protein